MFNYMVSFFKRFPNEESCREYLCHVKVDADFNAFETFGMSVDKFLFLIWLKTECNKETFSIEKIAEILGVKETTIKKANKYIDSVWNGHKLKKPIFTLYSDGTWEAIQ